MITRPDEAGGEDHTSVTEAEFDRIENAGGFALSWRAHGLRYGIPSTVKDDTAQGRDVLVNLSRAVLGTAQARFNRFAVLSLTAPVEVLAQRLAGRGRETADQIADRLRRAASPLPNGLPVIQIENAGPLDQTVDEILTRLQPPEGVAVKFMEIAGLILTAQRQRIHRKGNAAGAGRYGATVLRGLVRRRFCSAGRSA